MIRKLSIQYKLIAANVLVISLFILALLAALNGMLTTSEESEKFFKENLTRQEAYQNMFSNGLLSGIALRNLVLKPYLKKPYKVVPESIDRFDKAFKQVQVIPTQDPLIQQQYETIQKHWEASRNAKLKVLELVKAGDVDAAITLLTTVEHPNWQKVRVAVQKLTESEQSNNNVVEERILTNTNNALDISLVTAILAILAGGIISFFIILNIRKAFSNIISSLNDIASGEGDLTQRLDENGSREVKELSIAFNSFVEKIQNLVKQVADSSEQLIESIKKLTKLSVETKINVNQQEGSIGQVATAMNEMTSTVLEVARNASEASESAQSADRESEHGQQVVSEVINAINDLESVVGSTSTTIHTLEKDSEQIGSVLDVIKGIAEQTNLLALNAAIEAARAGEQGRGFAVVADEVRTLASRTQQSTQEIQEMIERLQHGAKDAVEAMAQGQEKTATTVEKAGLAGQALSAITQAVSNIAKQNSQIAVAAEEQSSVAEEINRNVVCISDLSGQVAEVAEHTAASSQELDRTANDLQNIISVFKV